MENATRHTKSDKGIQKLMRDVLMDVMGLPHETVNRVFKIIHARGDWATVKMHVRQTLPTLAWQRVNQALDMIDDQGQGQEEDERDPEMEPGEPVGDGESDAEYADGMDDADVVNRPEAAQDPEQRQEGFAPSFVDFLSEISASQTARMMVRDKQTRRDAALQTDMQRRTEINTELTDLENSEDPQEKNLANQVKRTAMLRKRVDDKKAADQAQSGKKPMGSF